MRTDPYKRGSEIRIITVTYFGVVVFVMCFLTLYAVYLSMIRNPPCKPCIDGITQEITTRTSTTAPCNTTNVNATMNTTDIVFNFTVSRGCTGPPGDPANLTILINKNAINTTIVSESAISTGESVFNLTIRLDTTYYTLPGAPGPKGPTSTIAGPVGNTGPQGPIGPIGVVPTRLVRITEPSKQNISIPVPPGAVLFTYMMVGGGGGGGGGVTRLPSGGAGGGGGGGSGFVVNGLLPITPIMGVITIRLGSGGQAGNNANTDYTSPGRNGYPTLLFIDGGIVEVADGGYGGNRPGNNGASERGGAGGDGGYGGGAGGGSYRPCPSCYNYTQGGGASFIIPVSRPGLSNQQSYEDPPDGARIYGGQGAGPNAGMRGFGTRGTQRVTAGGGGGGGGLLVGSGGNGAILDDNIGIYIDAADGKYGGGGGGGPGSTDGPYDRIGDRGGNGGDGYVEYVFF